MRSRLAVLAMALVAVGCGGPLTEYEGIYEISAWTENPDGCSSEGDSILDQQTETALFVQGEEFFGVEFVGVSLCTDIPECEERAAEEDTLDLGGFGFEEGSDDDGWRASSYSLSGNGDGGDCEGEVRQIAMVSPSDGVIRIESQIKDVTGIGRDADGFCDGDEAEEVAAEQPCNRLEVIEATFVSDL